MNERTLVAIGVILGVIGLFLIPYLLLRWLDRSARKRIYSSVTDERKEQLLERKLGFEEEEGLLILVDNFQDDIYKNRLVAVSDTGAFIVKHQIPEAGGYFYSCEKIPIEDIQRLTIKRHYAFLKSLLGLVLIPITLWFLWMMVRGEVSLGLRGSVCIFFAPFGALALYLGIRRVRVSIQTEERSYTWTSGPMDYTNGLETARTLVTWAKKVSIFSASHIDLRNEC